MYVGVILLVLLRLLLRFRVPHVCGGDPETLIYLTETFSVFPMYVGVILYEVQTNMIH